MKLVKKLLRVLGLLATISLGAMCGLFFLIALTHGFDSRDDIIGFVIPGLLAAMFGWATSALNRESVSDAPEEPAESAIDAPPIDLSDPDTRAALALMRREKIRRWMLIATPFLLVGGCVGYTVFDTLLVVKEASEYKACINNLRQLDPAILEFEKANHRPPRSVQEVIDSGKLGGGFKLACPNDGTYSLTLDDAHKTAAKCSVHGSMDHMTPQKHPH